MVTTAYLALLAAAFDQRVACSRAPDIAVGMADRNRAAVDVELFRSMPILSRQYSTCTAKASFNSQRSMSSTFEAVPLQEARHREHRTDAHFIGLAAGGDEAAEDARAVLGRFGGVPCRS
jgi:hypothetical protein